MNKTADLLPYVNARRLKAGLHPIASFGPPEKRRTAFILETYVWIYPWRTWGSVVDGNAPAAQQRQALVVAKDGRKEWFDDRELAPIDGAWLHADPLDVERHLCTKAENAILAAHIRRPAPREHRL